jgi:DNA adenine methylase
MEHEKVRFIRYPGGKQRILDYILPYLPSRDLIEGKYVEPFVGGGSVFFAIKPKYALLADINKELIDLYRGIRFCPLKIWEIYAGFPSTKKAYYEIRAASVNKKDLAFRAARTLYLNRTCFKGMWRHNLNGDFNIGYGGQDRRWALSKEILVEVHKRLKHVSLKCSDFEEIINACTEKDFIFVDPPYRPGGRDMINAHYVHNSFTYEEHQRLANTLKKASKRGIRWAMTTSSHPDILSLFPGYQIKSLAMGTGKSPGILTNDSKEALIYNYEN